MIISKFMTPADKVLSCGPSDSIEKALELALSNPDLGAVVVLHDHGNKHVPVGIVSKTDLLNAYKNHLGLGHPVKEIMSRDIETILESKMRDDAAEHFEKTKHHHVFVVNKDMQFVGLLTAWDVATQCARDNRAWPWNQEAVEAISARYSPRTARKMATIPKCPEVEPHSFLDIAGATEI